MQVTFLGESLNEWKQYISDDVPEKDVVFCNERGAERYLYSYISSLTGYVVWFEFQFRASSICNPESHNLYGAPYKNDNVYIQQNINSFLLNKGLDIVKGYVKK